MLEGQATNEKVLSPLPQYQIRQLKTAAELLIQIYQTGLPWFTMVYHDVWMGSLLL